MTDYLIFFIIVLGVNLMPAFGSPSWYLIVVYGLNTNLPLAPLVILGALAAAIGRFILAHTFRHFGNYLPEKTRRNLTAARGVLEQKKRNMIFGIGLFALSPLPSAQLFEAAGLAGVRLLSFTAAFFAGRLVSYSIYAMSAQSIKNSGLGEAFRRELTSPLGIALQLAMLGLLVVLSQIDWEKWLHHKTQGK